MAPAEKKIFHNKVKGYAVIGRSKERIEKDQVTPCKGKSVPRNACVACLSRPTRLGDGRTDERLDGQTTEKFIPLCQFVYAGHTKSTRVIKIHPLFVIVKRQQRRFWSTFNQTEHF